jgi:hypothetical protein
MKTISLAVGLCALIAIVGTPVTASAAEEGFLPLSKKSVTFSAKKVTYESTTGSAWVCGAMSGGGAFTSDGHGKGSLDFEKCTVLGFMAVSLGDKEGLILEPILFLVCLINSAKQQYGLFIELSESVHIELPALGLLLILAGSFIGEFLTKAGKLFIIDVTGSKGKPNITECKDQSGGVKKALLTESENGKSPVAEDVVTEGAFIQFEETVELME